MKKIDYKLLFLSSIAGILGIVMIYSASNIWAEYKFGDPLKYVKHQALFFIIGVLIMIILSKLDYKKYYKYANKILLIFFIGSNNFLIIFIVLFSNYLVLISSPKSIFIERNCFFKVFQ